MLPFVPMFSGMLVSEGKTAARRFAERLLAVLLLSQFIMLVIFEAIMPWFMHIFAPGFIDDPVKFDLAVLFTRITFPYLLFISLVSLQGAMLNALGRFTAAAAAPILMNLCFIAALLWLTPFMATAGHALSWGVLAAGVVQFLYLAWDSARAKMNLHLPWPRLTPDVKRFLRLLGPAALGAGVVQINLFADTLIASFLPTGAVSYLYYADRVNQLPLGVIGVAVGSVLLPELSRHLKRGDDAAGQTSQNRCIEWSLLLTLPCSAIFVTLAGPIMTELFQRGAFTAHDAGASAAALVAYALGLPAFVLVKSVLPGFHARGNTRTPVKVAVIAVAVNIGMKILLIGPFGVVGLAFATSVSGWVNFLLLGGLLLRQRRLTIDSVLRRAAPRIALCTIILTLALWCGRVALNGMLVQAAGLQGLAMLTLLGGGGMLAYGGLAVMLGLIQPLSRRRKPMIADP